MSRRASPHKTNSTTKWTTKMKNQVNPTIKPLLFRGTFLLVVSFYVTCGGRILCAGAFVAGLTMLAAIPAHAQPAPKWPQYGFDARHSMFNPDEHTLNQSNVAELSLQWQVGGGNAIAPLGGPALSDGVLYVPSQAQSTFMALDAATGTIRWTYTGTGFFSNPAVAYGYVYTAENPGKLYAFPTDCVGTCTPRFAVPFVTNSPPTVSNGKIYIGGYDG